MWFWKRNKVKKDIPTNKNFHFQFRVSFPLSNGSTRDTGNINIVIPASSMDEAVVKLNNYVLSKVKIIIINKY
jgi:hypothetical protein